MTTYATQVQQPTTPPPVPQDRRRRSPSLTAALLLSILVIAAGLLWLASTATSSTTRELVPIAGPIDALSADVGTGDVVVRAGDVTDVQLVRIVERGFVSPEFDEEVDGTTLTITGDCPWYAVGRCGVSYELVVPPDLIAQVQASSGDVVLEGLTGDMVVRASSGDIILRSVEGSIDAEVSSGDIVLEDVTGDIVASAGSGDVLGERVTADSVRAEVSSGDIKIDLLVSPDDLDARSSSGDVIVSVPNDGTSYAVDGKTSSGDREIAVATDPGSPNRARLQTSSGDAMLRYR
jgi:hypothetical protein